MDFRCLQFVSLKAIVIAYVVCLSSNVNGVEGRMLSEEEDLELEKELQRLSKSAVETIQTTYGDTYDCVDFYKQPAFDHPLLKNHSFHPQMKPSSYPKGRRPTQYSSSSSLSGFRPEKLWVNGKGCPIGTVPIRRITKEDLIRYKQASEIYASNLNPDSAERPGAHFAVVRTPVITGAKYYGAGMITSVWNPKLKDNSGYSSSQIKVQNGQESITIGWTVNPAVYKDQKTRLFIYTYARDAHCFNSQCGFIQTRGDIPLDAVLDPVSQPGGPIYTEHFFTFKEKASGNWYLELQNGTDYSTVIGWWPEKIFTATGLGDSANHIEFGGEVYSPPKIPSPEMGSGKFVPLPGEWRENAFCAVLSIVNEARESVEARNLESYTDIDKNLRKYSISDEGNIGGNFQHVVYYGGPGGYTGN